MEWGWRLFSLLLGSSMRSILRKGKLDSRRLKPFPAAADTMMKNKVTIGHERPGWALPCPKPSSDNFKRASWENHCTWGSRVRPEQGDLWWQKETAASFPGQAPLQSKEEGRMWSSTWIPSYSHLYLTLIWVLWEGWFCRWCQKRWHRDKGSQLGWQQ